MFNHMYHRDIQGLHYLHLTLNIALILTLALALALAFGLNPHYIKTIFLILHPLTMNNISGASLVERLMWYF